MLEKITSLSAEFAEITTIHQNNALMRLLGAKGVEAVVLTSTYQDAKAIDELCLEGVVPLIVDSMVDAATFTSVFATMSWIGTFVPDTVLILVESLDGLSSVEEYLFAALYGKAEVRLVMGDRGGRSLQNIETYDKNSFRELIVDAVKRKSVGV